jgi:hypothetical protein
MTSTQSPISPSSPTTNTNNILLKPLTLSSKSELSTTSSCGSTQNMCEAQLWKQVELVQWLTEIQLDKYEERFKQFDGKKLYRVYNWKIKESELYYRFITETFESINGEKVSTKDILIFEEELDKLFCNKNSDMNNNNTANARC